MRANFKDPQTSLEHTKSVPIRNFSTSGNYVYRINSALERFASAKQRGHSNGSIPFGVNFNTQRVFREYHERLWKVYFANFDELSFLCLFFQHSVFIAILAIHRIERYICSNNHVRESI